MIWTVFHGNIYGTDKSCLSQLGHQAVNCTNGTINWRQIYGDEAFRLKAPLYESELLRMRKDRAVDVEAWEKRAKEYAQVRLCVLHGCQCLSYKLRLCSFCIQGQ